MHSVTDIKTVGYVCGMTYCGYKSLSFIVKTNEYTPRFYSYQNTMLNQVQNYSILHLIPLHIHMIGHLLFIYFFIMSMVQKLCRFLGNQLFQSYTEGDTKSSGGNMC